MGGRTPYYAWMLFYCEIAMRLRVITVLLGILAASAMLAGQDRDAMVAEIAKGGEAIESLSCNFTQTRVMTMMDQKMVCTGCMKYIKGKLLRWEYLTPTAYLFILEDGKTTMQKDGQTISGNSGQNRVFREIARLMLDSVNGRCLTDEKLFKSTVSAQGNCYVAEMLPQRKEMKQMCSRIILTYDRKIGSVVKVQMLEQSGDSTIIEFKDFSINR